MQVVKDEYSVQAVSCDACYTLFLFNRRNVDEVGCDNSIVLFSWWWAPGESDAT